jgi:hypothetical protein
MEARLLAYVVAVAVLIAASLTAMASQSGTFVGVHEVPPFVCDRVELVRGLAGRPADDAVRSSGSYTIAQGDVSIPGRGCDVDATSTKSGQSSRP